MPSVLGLCEQSRSHHRIDSWTGFLRASGARQIPGGEDDINLTRSTRSCHRSGAESPQNPGTLQRYAPC